MVGGRDHQQEESRGGGGGTKGKPQPVTAKEKRVTAKEVSESRKPDYNLKKDIEVLWGKMIGRHLSKDDIIKLVTEALRKMDWKYLEFLDPIHVCSGSHTQESGKVRTHIIRILKKQIMKLDVSDYGCLVLFEELTKQLKEIILISLNRSIFDQV
ncbi:pumilio homolog 24-like isoform X2 [Triticum dicoccoides]|uniref:pumilio homolog 24-like isoform X2 n=1 Tax=Triticum dicoccoides TaxID=85692 RepID=UPI00188F55EA|nr:pumilio homolog 24-like isoform X2 [Triticum dicoccoides]